MLSVQFTAFSHRELQEKSVIPRGVLQLRWRLKILCTGGNWPAVILGNFLKMVSKIKNIYLVTLKQGHFFEIYYEILNKKTLVFDPYLPIDGNDE